MVFAVGTVERIIALVAIDLIVACAAHDRFIVFIAGNDLVLVDLFR